MSIIINTVYDSVILRTIVKRYWWWPALFVCFFGLFAFVYLRYTKPIYESSMVLQLGDSDKAKDVIDIENINTKDDEISGVVELLRSELLFDKALSALNLNVSLYARGEILTEEKYLSSSFNVQPYDLYDSTLINKEIQVTCISDSKIELIYEKGGKTKRLGGNINEHLKNKDFDIVVKTTDPKKFRTVSEGNELFFVFNGRSELSQRLIADLSVNAIDPNAKTISISFRGHNAQLCHDIVQAVSNTFVNFDEDQNRRSSENVLSFIDSQLDSLSYEVKNAKDSLVVFQRAAQIGDPDAAGLNLSENLGRLEDQLFDANEEYRALISIRQSLKDNPNRLETYKLLPDLLGRSFERSLLSHIQQLQGYLEEKEDLIYSGALAGNSKLESIESKIDSKMELIKRSIDAVEARLTKNRKAIKDKITQVKGESFALPEKRMEFNRLQNLQILNEKYFTLLAEKKVQYEISDAGYASSNRVLVMPKVNLNPVAPNSRFVYISFIIFGLIIGIGILTLKYLMFNEINMVEDLERILPEQASILGAIPLFKSALEFSQLIVSEAPKSIMAESMRKVRTNLSYIKPDYKTIAISSSISGEGKTFVALNLGGIIAMSGKKTVLLDLDLRKPKVHLGLAAENTVGMSSLIVGQSTLDECIQHSKLENLDFITAGPIPPNPSELLLSESFKTLIEELKSRYDVVIIDNPPIGLVSDGIRNLTEADIPIYIFKSHYSKRNFAIRIQELFDMKQLSSLNVILNGAKTSRRTGYGYGYGYGYGETYTEEGKNSGFENEKWYRRIIKKFRRR